MYHEDMYEIEKCSDCGSTPEVVKFFDEISEGDMFYVMCNGCGAYGESAYNDVEAIQNWNLINEEW
jgi:hypothetical protein